jgi:GNAT superfamily N-acetyltransferase
MYMDLALSQKLERTEGTVAASFAEAHEAVSACGAMARDFDGTVAIFDGVDSPMTQTFGLGLARPADDAQLDVIERFFGERGAATDHEVSPFAGVEVTGRLVARGYVPTEMSTVLVQAIDGAAAVVPASALRARAIDPAVDVGAWIETSVAGWGAEAAVAEFIRAIASVNVRNAAMTHYVVEDGGGVPVATGSLGVHDGVALLAGASTIPSARGRGAQALLLATRLRDARARGCELAMMVASVGSQSQRNAERNGFRVAYSRTKWRKSQG